MPELADCRLFTDRGLGLWQGIMLLMHLQVETLAGKVVAVDVDAAASLGAMREGIARQTGIVVKQQRLIVLGTHISLPFAFDIQSSRTLQDHCLPLISASGVECCRCD